MWLTVVVLGGGVDVLAAVYLLHLLQRSAPDWNGRPTIFACLAAVVTALALGVGLVLIGHQRWAAFVALGPMILLIGGFVVVAAIGIFGGGRWN